MVTIDRTGRKRPRLLRCYPDFESDAAMRLRLLNSEIDRMDEDDLPTFTAGLELALDRARMRLNGLEL